MLDFLTRWDFLLTLAAAWFLWRNRPDARVLALGLGLMGFQGIVVLGLNTRVLPEGTARLFLGQVPWFFITIIVAAGAMLLAADRVPGAAPVRAAAPGGADAALPARQPPTVYLNPADATMESLVIPRNATNSFTRAEVLRDQLYERIERESQRAGVPVVGYKSPARSGTVWARFDFVLPQDTENLSLRAGLTVTIERYDFHRYEHLITLQLSHGTQKKTVPGLLELTDGDLRALLQFTKAGGGFPALASQRVRLFPFQLWRPRNKVERLRTDWLMVGITLGLVLIFFIPVVGPISAIIGFFLFRSYLKKRKTYILTTGKPLHDPRELIRMDGWQTTIYRLGPRIESVKAALLERLRASSETGIEVAPERIWYPGIDGKVEREQIVCTFRRAHAFLHLERYGDDLYVGWDSHVNGATWLEQTLARGVDRATGRPVVANRVVPGWQAPTEYDITDVNFLTEWLHAAVTRAVRLAMEEQRIDQEIDFTVQRESRKAALQTAAPARGVPAGGVAGALARLRRVA